MTFILMFKSARLGIILVMLFLQITEMPESFSLTLSDPQGGAVIGPEAVCTVIIVANDFPIRFQCRQLSYC